MKQINVKKLLLPNLPMSLSRSLPPSWGRRRGWLRRGLFTKVAAHHGGLRRRVPIGAAQLPPHRPVCGAAAALLIRLAVYVKGKNARKFRKNIEYGSARWGNAEDIKPYVDPTFANNVILTQTERLTMNSRPKDPKTARNKTCWWWAAPAAARRGFH